MEQFLEKRGVVVANKTNEILLSCEIFSSLSNEEKDNIAEKVQKIAIKKGDEISLRESLGCIAIGSARVLVKNAGGAVMKKLESREVFGCAALFGGETVTEIKADSDATIVYLSASDMTDVFMQHPTVAVDYIKYLSGKIRYLNSRIGDFAPAPAETRVLGYLKKLSEKQSPIKMPMTRLAGELGIGRTSLYRALEVLEQSGAISRSDNGITVC